MKRNTSLRMKYRALNLVVFLVTSCLSIVAQTNLADFFSKSDVFLKEVVNAQKVDYLQVAQSEQLTPLLKFIADFDYDQIGGEEQKAYLLNAYNLLVIGEVVENYPVQNLLKVYGFFEQQNVVVRGETVSLNKFEKDIFSKFPDARLHFALSCAALSCPPLAPFAYQPDNLDAQLDRRSSLALDDPEFLKVDATTNQVGFSQIFKWYEKDFGNDNELRDFVNTHRSTALPENYRKNFYPYDWTLNDANLQLTNNASRYVVSSTRPKGTVEAKWFNNLYSQQIPSSGRQENYFTSQLGFLYGLTDRLNVGFDLRYRLVSFASEPAGAFGAFGSNLLQSRNTLATFGPKIRIAPNEKWPNMSIQSALWFPLTDQLEGGGEAPWLDWSSPTWFTQVFNDFSIGGDWAFFLEVDVVWEDIGLGNPDETNRFSTPVTGILSYFPTPKSTLYALTNFAPIWKPTADYYAQAGLGAKYQLHRNFEIELLYSYFTNQFLIDNQGRASTFNIGFRYSN